METALLIICALLLLALVTCICAMLIYTHKRMDDIVKMFNINSQQQNERFDEMYKNYSNIIDGNKKLEAHVNGNMFNFIDEINILKKKLNNG